MGGDEFGDDQYAIPRNDGRIDMRYSLCFVPSIRDSVLELETVLLVGGGPETIARSTTSFGLDVLSQSFGKSLECLAGVSLG